MKFKSQKIEKLYKYLSSMSQKAYSDPLLISNDILCKQDSHGLILRPYFSGKIPPKKTLFLVLKKFFLYFIKNFSAFFLYLVMALGHRFSKQMFRFKEKSELMIVDTYLLPRKIIEQNQFVDAYFSGLAGVLARRKNNYVYVPRLFVSMNPLEWFKVFRIFKKNKDPVLTEFQLFKFIDYLKIVRFIFFYPFSVLRFVKTLGVTQEDRILCNGLWQSFDSVAFHGYVRFLLGRRLSFLKNDKIKCLSWYENQSADKNFYRGLRCISKRVDIIGAQLFVRPDGVLNLIPDEQEAPFDVIPNRILVNGLNYIFMSEYAQVEVGPSLRNAHLFQMNVNPSKGDTILVLMPYWGKLVMYILNIIHKVSWPVPVKIKFHPTTDRKLYKQGLLKKFFVTEETLPDLLSRTRMVVGGSGGGQLEVAALGIPVIDILNPNEFSHCCMPEIGKGILWDQAADANDVTRAVNQFQEILQSDSSQLEKEGARIKSFYFSKPTDELIENMLGLDKAQA